MLTTAELENPDRPWPDFLTIEEAAKVLRIGRSSAYVLAKQFVITDGALGLPAVQIGRHLRVPSNVLEEWRRTRPQSPADLAAKQSVRDVRKGR